MPRKPKSKKGHNSGKKMHFDLSPLIVRIGLWIVNTYSQFQVNMCSNRDTTKCQSFCTMATTARLQQYLRFSLKTARLKIALYKPII